MHTGWAAGSLTSTHANSRANRMKLQETVLQQHSSAPHTDQDALETREPMRLHPHLSVSTETYLAWDERTFSPSRLPGITDVSGAQVQLWDSGCCS